MSRPRALVCVWVLRVVGWRGTFVSEPAHERNRNVACRLLCLSSKIASVTGTHVSARTRTRKHARTTHTHAHTHTHACSYTYTITKSLTRLLPRSLPSSLFGRLPHAHTCKRTHTHMHNPRINRNSVRIFIPTFQELRRQRT